MVLTLSISVVSATSNYSGPTPFSGDVIFGNEINITLVDNVDTMTVSLFNSSHSLLDNDTAGSPSASVLFSPLSSGIYYFNASNATFSLETRNILVINDVHLNTVSPVLSTAEFNNDTIPGLIVANGEAYGYSIAPLGDLNGDGNRDIAVSTHNSDISGTSSGVVNIHFLNSNGGVSNTAIISTNASIGLDIKVEDQFGSSITNIGDLDGDGIQDLVVGAPRADPNSIGNSGTIYVVFMNSDGSAKNATQINGVSFPSLPIVAGEYFGTSVTDIGDLDGDGIQDIAASSPFNNTNSGVVYILNLNRDGSLKGMSVINSDTVSDLKAVSGDKFGFDVTSIGDLDGDGVQDIVASAYHNSTGGTEAGAVHILFMDRDGSVKSTTMISANTANGPGIVAGDHYGYSVGSIGDLNGDGIQDLAVGAYGDDSTSGNDRGAVYIHFLDRNGGVKDTVKIDDHTTNGPILSENDLFGSSIANLGDINGDGTQELAVGAIWDDAGGNSRGTVHILSLNSNSVYYRNPTPFSGDIVFGDELNITLENKLTSNMTLNLYNSSNTLIESRETADTNASFIFNVANGIYYFNASTSLGTTETRNILVVNGDYLNAVSPVSSTVEINNVTTPDLVLGDRDLYGYSIANIGDLNGDGVQDLASAAYHSDNGGSKRGALYISFMNHNGSVKNTVVIDSSTLNGPDLKNSNYFGKSIANIGDLDGDGIQDIAVGASNRNNPPVTVGELHIIFMNSTGGVKSSTLINGSNTPGLPSVVNESFGASIANLGDFDGDGIQDLAVGAPLNDTGALYILNMQRDGGVANVKAITPNTPNTPAIVSGEWYGHSIANIGDLDDDGIQDIVTGIYLNDTGGADRGAVYISFLNRNGSIKNTTVINSDTINGPNLANNDRYGFSVVNAGDLNNDGIQDLAVCAIGTDNNKGSIHLHYMARNGDVKRTIEIGNFVANGPILNDNDHLGVALTNLGDLNGDGIQELAAGAPYDFSGGIARGTVHIISLNSGSLKYHNPTPFSGDIVFGDELNITLENELTSNMVVNLYNSSHALIESRETADTNASFVFDVSNGVYYFNASTSLGTTETRNILVINDVHLNAVSPVLSSTEINSLTPNGPNVANNNFYGNSIANLGDLNGDGIQDLAVSAYYNDTGGTNRGAVFIHFMDPNGVVNDTVTIDSSSSNGPDLQDNDYFGSSIANIGDLDGDGVQDLAVGAQTNHSTPIFNGAVHIIFMNSDGSVKRSTQINSSNTPSLPAVAFEYFGSSISTIGDLNDDGVQDILVGASNNDTGGKDRGALYILFMQKSGSVDHTMVINSDTTNGPSLDNDSIYGFVATNIGDLDGDGIQDIAATGSSIGTGYGKVFISFLNRDGSVKDTKILNSTTTNIPGLTGLYGRSLANVGDLNNDGIQDLAVGAVFNDNGIGSLYLHYMDRNGGVKRTIKVGNYSTNGPVLASDLFGKSIANIGDINDDGIQDLAAGAYLDDAGGSNRGTVHIISLNLGSLEYRNPTPFSGDVVFGDELNITLENMQTGNMTVNLYNSSNALIESRETADTNASFVFDVSNGVYYFNASTSLGTTETRNILVVNAVYLNTVSPVSSFIEISNATVPELIIENSNHYGYAVANIGDLDGDGIQDLAASARNTDIGGTVYIHFMDNDGSVKDTSVIDSTTPNGPSNMIDYLGTDIDSIGDLDEDGVQDLAIGASNSTSVFISFMNSDGTVKRTTQINSSNTPGVPSQNENKFGRSVSNIGDIDGDHIPDLAVGAHLNDTGSFSNDGAVYILLMQRDGSVRNVTVINDLTSNGPELSSNCWYGVSIENLGDLNGDGVMDIAVGAESRNYANGTVFIHFMNSDGSINFTNEINHTNIEGINFPSPEHLGTSVANLGDLDGDGIQEIAIGAIANSDAGTNTGAAYICFLNSDGDVKSAVELTTNTFNGPDLVGGDQFGRSISSLGDINGDGTQELAIGAFGADPVGGPNCGIAYIISLNTGSLEYHNPTPFSGDIVFGDELNITLENKLPGNMTLKLFNSSNALIESRETADTNASFVFDVSNGVYYFNASTSLGTTETRNVLVVNAFFLNPAYPVLSTTEINNLTVPDLILNDDDYYGFRVANLGDLNGDGIQDLAASAHFSNNGGTDRGAVYIHFMDQNSNVVSTVTIDSNTTNGPDLQNGDKFGADVANLGDLDGDGIQDLAIGAPALFSGSTTASAVHILFMNSDGSVKRSTQINSSNTPGLPSEDDHFGYSVSNLGDLDGDGIQDLAVGAFNDSTGGSGRGAVYILNMLNDGSVKDISVINSSTANGPDIANGDGYGWSLATLGDLDNDGIQDIAVGADYNDTGGSNRGAVYISFLNRDGSVKNTEVINDLTVNGPDLTNTSYYGYSVANLGDLNSDGIQDIGVGSPGGNSSVHIHFMDTNAGVKDTILIDHLTPNSPISFGGTFFGTTIENLGDFDGDDSPELAVTDIHNDTGGTNFGNLYIISLNVIIPKINITSPIENYNYTVNNITLNVTSNVEISAWNYSINGTTNVSFSPNTTLIELTEGSNNVTVYAITTTGIKLFERVNFSVDTHAPIISLIAPVEDYLYNTSSISLNVTANENISMWNYSINGTANVTFDPNVTINGVSDGTNNITVYAFDESGNLNFTMVNFSVDATPPILSLTSPTNSGGNYTIENVDLNVTANENISKWRYSLDNGANESFVPNLTLSSLSDGVHTLVIDATDLAINVNSSTIVFNVSTPYALITIDSPVEGQTYYTSSVDLNVSADESINDWWYSFDNGVTNDTFTPNQTLSGLTSGAKTLTVYGNNSAGVVGSATVNFAISVSSSGSNIYGAGESNSHDGGSTLEPPENIAEKNVNIEKAIADKRVRSKFIDNEVITSVGFVPVGNFNYVDVAVEVLRSRSATVPDDPEGVVYKHTNIFVRSNGISESGAIIDNVIEFKVAQEWFDNNDAEHSSIVLFRHNNGKWTALPTGKTFEEAGYVHYKSDTPGFSPFVIVSVAEDVVIEEPKDIVDPEEPLEQKQELPLGIILGAVGAILIIFLLIRRKMQNE